MKKLIDCDELYKALSQWDWQDLYLPVHFKELVDELPAVGGVYTEQDVRDSYNDGFSLGVRRGYEDAVLHYAKMALKQWIPVSERLPGYGEDVLVSVSGYCNVGHIVPTNDEKQYNWYYSGWYHDPYDVDAWMPLPEPYDEP